MFNSWQLNLILFYVFVVLFFQCYKLAVKKVENDGAATVALQAIAGTSILILAPFFALKWSASLGIIVLLVASCIFYAINDRLQMTARKHLEVSTFSVIGQLSTVFVILYGLTIFREHFTWAKLAGAVLIIGANVLIFLSIAQAQNRDQYIFYPGNTRRRSVCYRHRYRCRYIKSL
jgi:drug/metabolite transporter (DMT)-like permease